MWIEYNPNPCAQRDIDCTVRAMCKAIGGSWEQNHFDLCELSRKMCTMPNKNSVWGALLRMHGWRRYAVPDYPPNYTVAEFAADHPYGEYVLGCDGHVVTLVYGDWYDIFDSAGEIVEYFWIKE